MDEGIGGTTGLDNNSWYPNPGPQTRALQSNAFETLYGGARGGGKTDAGLVWMLKCITIPNFRGLVIRKNADDLSDWVDRAAGLYKSYGANIAYRPAIIKFPSGAIIRTGHLKDDQAYTKYQGHEYHRMLIEELTQIPDEKRYLQLVASCRSTVPGLDARVFATTNPGGVGHGWVKRRFVDPSPPNTKFSDISSGRSRVFIPAKVEDTPQLVKNDPGYVQFLEGLKSTDVELWKAWRLGDWDTFAGQFFKEFRRDLHVCRPFIPNKNNVIVGGMDWGRTAPFGFYLDEISPQQTQDGDKYYRSKTFLEAYGTDRTPKEWADVIKEKMKFFKLKSDDVTWIQGDPAMFTKGNDGSISIADQFRREGIIIKPGSNDRVGGWENLHNWLSLAPDGFPYWQITENCTQLIRTLPELVHDENKVEDVDTQSEDHGPDAQRYLKKALKWIGVKVGGYSHAQPRTATVRKTAEFINIDGEQKQRSLNISKFAQPDKGSRDKRVGAIRRA